MESFRRVIPAMAQATFRSAGAVRKMSGRSSSRNCRRALGMPSIRHSLTDGDFTLHSFATAAVPPNASMISESFMPQ